MANFPAEILRNRARSSTKISRTPADRNWPQSHKVGHNRPRGIGQNRGLRGELDRCEKCVLQGCDEALTPQRLLSAPPLGRGGAGLGLAESAARAGLARVWLASFGGPGGHRRRLWGRDLDSALGGSTRPHGQRRSASMAVTLQRHPCDSAGGWPPGAWFRAARGPLQPGAARGARLSPRAKPSWRCRAVTTPCDSGEGRRRPSAWRVRAKGKCRRRPSARECSTPAP